jgi:hypothetical protein
MTAENTRSESPSNSKQANAKQSTQTDAVATRQREVMNGLVKQQVLHALGRPGDLLQVQVRPLWSENYRVNVFVGPSHASARIANSYFIVTDGDGTIRQTYPAIQRSY